MNTIEPRWHLYSIHGTPLDWPSLHAHNVLWHERKLRALEMGRTKYEKNVRRPFVGIARSVTLTDAGRAYIAALREQVR